MRVLVAEDNPVFRSMLRGMLTKWGYQVAEAKDGNEALHELDAKEAPRLAILDWMMPGLDGVEVCRRVRAAAHEPYIYILLLTARTESRDLVEGMDSGADDYLTKPFNAQELRVRLRAGRRILELQAELVGAREALRVQATHDALTGLWNRAAILEFLDNELARAAREPQSLAALMMDIDRFKLINDTHGHQAGDAVLREVARRMKSVMRRYDAVGRYGGEEFLIVLPGCDLQGGRRQGERIREALLSSPFDIGDRTLDVTCSVGLACRDTRGLDVPALIRDADEMLYQAKHQGRNRVCWREPASAEDPDLARLDAGVRAVS